MHPVESTYTVRIHDEKGNLWATVDEVPGCFAAGDDLRELVESLREGLSLALSSEAVDVDAHIEALDRLLEVQVAPGAVVKEHVGLC